VDVAGTAPIRIEALGYSGAAAGKYNAPESYDTGTYTVQIGSFKEYANAQRLSMDMRNIHGFSEVHMTLINGENFYRVYAGKYASLKAAEHAEKEFSDHGFPGSFSVSMD
jgi:rare lipoprotein A